MNVSFTFYRILGVDVKLAKVGARMVAKKTPENTHSLVPPTQIQC